MILLLFFSTLESSFREMRRLLNGKYEVKESYECVITVVCRILEDLISHADCIQLITLC